MIGKNNEGKSNLLSAFSVSMSILRSYAEERVQRQLLMHNIRYNYNYSDANYYQWSRDYPISLQKANKAQFSEFILEFLLSEDEIVSFKSKIGNKLNGILPISITIGSDNQPKIKVRKQGKGSKPLNSKSQKIAKYIAQNIEYNYIPAIRTDEESMEIINRQISQELQVLRNNKDYKAAIAKINELRKPVLAKLSGNIQEVLKSFLPDLSSVEINVRDDDYQYRRSFDFSLKIDDGTKTDLQNKGDGIKSLVTLSLLNNRHINSNAASVVAIEEPESHLHPEAISALKDTIIALSSKSQVIISTHNPLFVNRSILKSNIIINKGQAKQASSIRDIRDILGVKVSDNLYDADTLLIVEGKTDEKILRTILSAKSEIICNALKKNILSIMPIGGAKNLCMYLSIFKHLICDIFVFVDNDSAGNDAIKKALEDNILCNTEYLLCKCVDMPNESEIEDCIDKNIYSGILSRDYGIDVVNANEFKRKDKKWTERIKSLYIGKIWTEDIKNQIKSDVASTVCNNLNPGQVLDEKRVDIINKLIENLERVINKN